MNHFIIIPKMAYDGCAKAGITAWDDVIEEVGKDWKIFTANDISYEQVISGIAEQLGNICMDDERYGYTEFVLLEYDWLRRPLFDAASVETLVVETRKAVEVKIADGTYIFTSED